MTYTGTFSNNKQKHATVTVSALLAGIVTVNYVTIRLRLAALTATYSAGRERQLTYMFK